VLFEDSALRRMARHLSRPDIGAVTAYIKEGTPGGNYLTRFIAYEYVTAQAAARRAQNVFGALACLAGGAQLHSRENLSAIGGRIDTSTLAEDTVTTFRTQLSGRRVVFEPNAVVWAEEPGDLDGLWRQRLRWARGNVQISLQFSRMWFHGRKYGGLSGTLFSFTWFTVVLMPVLMIVASTALLGLYVLDSAQAWTMFQMLWIFHAAVYVFVTAMSFALDPSTARRAWWQGLLFPGVIALAIIVYSVAPEPLGVFLRVSLETIGVEVTPGLILAAQVFSYGWLAGSMLVACAARWVERRGWLFLSKMLLYLGGYGAFLCAVTFAAYFRELLRARLTWEKTIKTGKVVVAR
jgi:cellulose synthase/poly-beta-1,6-N-acetylglucosamine synthase-like glycosyltransferase